MTIKAILFDVDNTLLDFSSMKEMAVKAAIMSLKDHGLRMDKDEAYEKLMRIYWDLGIESDIWISEFLKKYDSVSDIKIIAAINAYRKVKNTYLEPFPTVYSTLIALIKKGIKLGVISDAPRLKVLKRLEIAKLLPFFDIIISDARKPEETSYKKAIKNFDINAKETLMVGDWPETDLAGAENVGIKTCHAKYRYVKRIDDGRLIKKVKIKPDYEINNFYEILDIINKESKI